MCSFSRAWLLVIHRSLYVRTRSRSRTICAGDFRFYPMFIALVVPTSDVIWRGESNSHHNGTRFLLIYIPGIQSFFIQKVSNSIRRLPWASIVGKIQTRTLICFRKRKKQRSRWAWLSSRTTVIIVQTIWITCADCIVMRMSIAWMLFIELGIGHHCWLFSNAVSYSLIMTHWYFLIWFSILLLHQVLWDAVWLKGHPSCKICLSFPGLGSSSIPSFSHSMIEVINRNVQINYVSKVIWCYICCTSFVKNL